MNPQIVAAALGTALGIAATLGAFGFGIGTPAEPQAGFFPLLGGLLVGAASIVVLLHQLREQHAAAREHLRTAFENRGALVLAATLATASLVLDVFGFVPTMGCVAIVVLRTLGTPWRLAGVVGIMLPGVLYVVFKSMLGVDLPSGLLDLLG